MKAGPFDIDETLALVWLHEPNVTGRPNSDVLRPRLTARDLLQRQPLGWIIDFGCDSAADGMAGYESPWKHVQERVKPERLKNRRARMALKWWLHGEARPGLRASAAGLSRFIVTPEVSKNRVFAWLDDVFLADHKTRAFSTADNYTFGVLHLIVHRIWALSQGSQLRDFESGFSYTPTTCFETFPFPTPMDAQRDAIAAAAKDLDTLRSNWLNPPEWTKTDVMEFPGSVAGPWKRFVHDANANGVGTVRYPRTVPKDADAAAKLKKRTLTNLYNESPAWLKNAHRKRDETVFAAYGWPADTPADALLARLLALNLERAAKQGVAARPTTEGDEDEDP